MDKPGNSMVKPRNVATLYMSYFATKFDNKRYSGLMHVLMRKVEWIVGYSSNLSPWAMKLVEPAPDMSLLQVRRT